MQSGPHTFDAVTTPQARAPHAPAHPQSPQALAPQALASQAQPGYTPRTVWQTPHGLAPTFTRPRSARTHDVARIVRRCMRLVYRLRRASATARITTPAPRACTCACACTAAGAALA